MVLTDNAIITLFFTLFSFFLASDTQLYKRLCPSVCPSRYFLCMFEQRHRGRDFWDFQGSPLLGRKTKQVTRGHNIVANGWAGASNTHSHPMLPIHTQKTAKTRILALFYSCPRTNRQIDRRTKPDVELRVRI